ncbi:MAG: tetratricopeptide repeat protein [Candidatus Aminicenantes bacterium]|nr:tetratricopeptide repeat protein [Candidatus Aminicenantes bacterium]MCK5003825.1 tetratricopeptide repeat protein [Candidatus Aminicenantes bacterium]
MKSYLIIVLIILFAFTSCVTTKKVKYDIDIPEIDVKGYNDPFFKEGWESLKTGQVDLAYEKFKESNSQDYKLYNAFGYVYLLKNKLNNAARNFKESIKLEKDNIQAEYGLAMISEIRNDHEKAFLIYSELLSKYPETAWIRTKYEFIKSRETQKHMKNADENLTSNNNEGYIRSLEKASEFSPEITEIKLKIGDHYFQNNDFVNASKYYEYALENRPNEIDILNKLAESYENSENLDSAIVIFKKLLKLKPGDISITNRINDLKIKFHEIDLPVKFKNIFFKENINREELAALIGHYFGDYIFYEGQPVILTDIKNSFAKDHIIKVCSSGIIKGNPGHSFDRFTIISRSFYATVISSLLDFLQDKSKLYLKFTPSAIELEPSDISPLHRNYRNIKFLLKTQILKLDEMNNFNPTKKISPSDVMISLRKIIKSIQK